MWWVMAAQAGMGMLNGYRKAKEQRAWDKYNNAMVGIQAAQSQNNISENVAANRDQHAANKVAIQSSRLMAAAKVKAGAAAAGVAGGAVEATLFDVGRNAGKRLLSETDRFDASLQVTDQQRKNVAFQKQMATKQVTKKPNLLEMAVLPGLEILGNQMQQTGSSGTQIGGIDSPRIGEVGTGSDMSTWETIRQKLMI